jgi:hypothetical protein
MDSKMLALTFLISGTLFFLAAMCLAEVRLADRQARNRKRAMKRERLYPIPPQRTP